MVSDSVSLDIHHMEHRQVDDEVNVIETHIYTPPTPPHHCTTTTTRAKKKISRNALPGEGFGRILFYDWRYLPGEKPNPEFVLNFPRYKGASVLLTRGAPCVVWA